MVFCDSGKFLRCLPRWGLNLTMHIVHVVESFAGGVLDYLRLLVGGLPEYRHTIVYGRRRFTPANPEALFPPDTEFVFWPHTRREISPYHDARAAAWLFRFLRARRGAVDVLHLHSSKAGMLGRMVGRALGFSRVVYTPHGVSMLRQDVSSLKRLTFGGMERLGALFGGDVVACSRSECGVLRRWGIRSHYIFTGMPLPENLPMEPPADGVMRIGTVGRISAPKAPEMFDALARRFLRNERVRFIWVGDGELRPRLQSPNIEITGWLDAAGVWRALAQLDIYLSTSLWEGFPLGVLRAMAVGKPLVLHACVGNVDAVDDGRNGYLFRSPDEAADRLHGLVASPSLREEMGAFSRRLLETRFSYERMLKAYRRLYSGGEVEPC